MTTEPENLNGNRSGTRNERRLVEEAQRDLRRAFPWLTVDQVSVVVECIWAEYDDALVRDFVPILVRKQAREELRHQFHATTIDTTETRCVPASSATSGDPDHDVPTPAARPSRSPWTRRGRRLGRAGPQGLVGSACDVECG